MILYGGTGPASTNFSMKKRMCTSSLLCSRRRQPITVNRLSFALWRGRYKSFHIYLVKWILNFYTTLQHNYIYNIYRITNTPTIPQPPQISIEFNLFLDHNVIVVMVSLGALQYLRVCAWRVPMSITQLQLQYKYTIIRNNKTHTLIIIQINASIL